MWHQYFVQSNQYISSRHHYMVWSFIELCLFLYARLQTENIANVTFSALFNYMLWHIELQFCFNVLQINFECRYFASIFEGVMLFFIRPSSDLEYRKVKFSAHFSYLLWHIELKFCIWLCFNVLQIKFECRHFLKELYLFLYARLQTGRIIRPSSDGTYIILWYGDVRPSVRISVRPSVWVSVRPFSALFPYIFWDIWKQFSKFLFWFWHRTKTIPVYIPTYIVISFT